MTGGHRRILVVEDDPETAGQLVEELTTSGYEVDLAATGREALSHGAARDYAVITIDRMLPDIDGIAVMRQMRDDGVASPFLIISALGEVDDRVRGLRAGGDDYLVKPYAFTELLARIEVLARRSSPAEAATSFEVGGLALDRLSRKVERDGEQILLQPREFRLLEYLMKNAGKVVTRTMLLENVWDYHFDPQTNVIDVHVSRLRSKIEKDFSQPLLKTIRGAGYMIKDEG